MNVHQDNTYNEPREVIIPFSQLLTEEEISLIKQNSNVVKYHKKEVIFRQTTRTSHIMLIRSGLVKVYREDRNDKVIILKILKAYNFLGLMSIFGHDLHHYSASAMTDSEIEFIDIGVFRNVLMANGKYTLKMLNLVSSDGLYIFDRLMSQSHKQLPGKIADVLIYFSEEIFNSSSFSFPLTRRELAEFAGTTKESLIRTLTEFKHDKIISLDGSDVNIISWDIVKTLSQLG